MSLLLIQILPMKRLGLIKNPARGTSPGGASKKIPNYNYKEQLRLHKI